MKLSSILLLPFLTDHGYNEVSATKAKPNKKPTGTGASIMVDQKYGVYFNTAAGSLANERSINPKGAGNSPVSPDKWSEVTKVSFQKYKCVPESLGVNSFLLSFHLLLIVASFFFNAVVLAVRLEPLREKF